MSSERYQRRALLATAGTAAVASAGCLNRLPRPGGVPDGVESTDVFVSGEEGYPTYRIPALLATTEGTLLAFCEGRRKHSGDRVPVDLLVKRSTDGGRTWSDQQVVYSEGKATISNPTPVVDQSTGTVHLPFCREYRDALVTRSEDDGRTWSDPQEITDSVKRDDWGYYATGPGVGIQLERGNHAGRLLIPATHWTYLWEGNLPEDNVRYNHVIYSDDGGKNWELGGTVGPHLDEPQAVELPDGGILMNMRNYWAQNGGRSDVANTRATAISPDAGATWSEVRFDHTLVTPTCQASLVRYSWPEDGRSRLLFSNPADRNSRVDLTVRLSYDEGRSWSHSGLLHASQAAYSCLAPLPDGAVGCLFEGGDLIGDAYDRLVFRRFDLDWLTDGADAVA